MSFIREVIQHAKDNYRRIINGEDINIPFPFKRFSRFVPGIQQGRYYIVTANSKVSSELLTNFNINNLHR